MARCRRLYKPGLGSRSHSVLYRANCLDSGSASLLHLLNRRLSSSQLFWDLRPLCDENLLVFNTLVFPFDVALHAYA